jgi:hypothetical protein
MTFTVCQTGCVSAGLGDTNDNGGGYFSAGVLKTAFAADDPSATPLAPKNERFAVVPTYEKDFEMFWYADETMKTMKVRLPLFCVGRDTHGNVACAACHGAAHGICPNADPSASKAGFKSKIVKVASGEFIGCDTCHNIETSCIGSPAGGQCGVATSVVAGGP